MKGNSERGGSPGNPPLCWTSHVLLDGIISSRCPTTSGSVSELTELRSHLSTSSLKEVFLPLGGEVGGREEWPTSGTGQVARGGWEWGSHNTSDCLNQIKPNTCSAVLRKTWEENLSKNHHHHHHPKKSAFSHEFSLALRSSKSNSDVIHQQRHTHFRK